MITKTNPADSFVEDAGTDIVVWGPRYITGIKLVDQQHQELVSLTNDLYHACLAGKEMSGNVFKNSMSRMVEYVRFHFTTEQKLLQKINYPQYAEHKKKHEDLIRSILTTAKDFNEGKKFVPNHFVRTLKDWVFGHIGIEDKIYATYVAEQKKKGLLTDAELDSLTAD